MGLVVLGVPMFDQALYDRIMARCVETPGPLDTPCLVWYRPKYVNNYGYIRLGKRVTRTHRAAYEAAYGPIANGLLCLHKCDVKPCCNINHLYAGTCQQNVIDAIVRGLAPTGEDRPAAKLTLQMVQQIRAICKSRILTQSHLARVYNVHRGTINRIAQGVTWAEREGGNTSCP